MSVCVEASSIPQCSCLLLLPLWTNLLSCRLVIIQLVAYYAPRADAGG